MTSTITYQDGSPVRDGDAVTLNGGLARGTVVQIVETAEQAKAHRLSGPGAVVDVDPQGVVFLTVDLIAEEPLVLIERGPDESMRFHAQTAIAAGAVVVLPALWSFFAAIYSALTTGEVMVMSFGGDGGFEDVPWRRGWARFVGPLVLLYALWLVGFARPWSRSWWLGAVGCAVALGLLGFSLWFTSLNGAIAFVGFSTFMMIAFYLDKRFGRAAAFAFISTVIAIAAWRIGSTS